MILKKILLFAASLSWLPCVKSVKYSLAPEDVAVDNAHDNRHSRETYFLLDENASLMEINAIIAQGSEQGSEQGQQRRRFSLALMTPELYDSAVSFLSIMDHMRNVGMTIQASFYESFEISSVYPQHHNLYRALRVESNKDGDGETYLTKNDLRVARVGEVVRLSIRHWQLLADLQPTSKTSLIILKILLGSTFPSRGSGPFFASVQAIVRTLRFAPITTILPTGLAAIRPVPLPFRRHPPTRGDRVPDPVSALHGLNHVLDFHLLPLHPSVP